MGQPAYDLHRPVSSSMRAAASRPLSAFARGAA